MFTKIKKHSLIIVPVLLFIAAFILRSIKAGYFPLWDDELITARWTRLDYMLVYHHFDNNIPFAPTINLFFKELFHDNLFAQRFPVILFGSLSVVVFYQMMRYFLKNGKWALFFSLIPLTSFILIFFSQEIRPYSYFIFLALVTLYYGFRVFVEGSENKLHILLLLAAFLSLPLIHYMSWLHFIALDGGLFLGIIIFSKTKLLNILKLFVANLFILIAYIPWSDSAYQYAFNNLALRGNPAAKFHFTPAVFERIINIFAGGGGNWNRFFLYLALAAGLFLIYRLSSALLRKNKIEIFDQLIIILFFYLGIIAFFVTQMRYTEEVIFERHYLFLIWPFFILIFYTLFNLTKWRATRLIATIIVILILGSNIVNDGAYFLAPSRFFDWKTVAEFVEPIILSGRKQKIYTSNPGRMFNMKWYLKSEKVKASIDGKAPINDAVWQEMKKEIAKEADQMIFISVIANYQDPEPLPGFSRIKVIGKSPYLDFLTKRKTSPYGTWYEIAVIYY